jgi:hypothetical protein
MVNTHVSPLKKEPMPSCAIMLLTMETPVSRVVLSKARCCRRSTVEIAVAAVAMAAAAAAETVVVVQWRRRRQRWQRR